MYNVLYTMTSEGAQGYGEVKHRNHTLEVTTWM